MNPGNNNFGGPQDGRGRAILGKPFTLSAAAPEFFPRNYAPAEQTMNGLGMNAGPPMYGQQGPGPAQGQMPPHVNPNQMGMPQAQMANMYAPQHSSGQAGGGPQHQQYNPPRGGGPSHYQPRHSSGSRHHQALPQATPTSPDPTAQLKQAILILTKDPASFDDLMPELTSTLSSTIQTEERLIKMVDDLFRQAVEEANFRYTGARISNYFSHHLSASFPSGSFKDHLLRKCHDEHKKRGDLVLNCDCRYKLVGFTLFMGELLLNLTEFVKVSDGSDYMSIIATAVQELLLTHLTQPAEDTLRCVVQVLKLCGSVIEDTEKLLSSDKETPHVDSIFSTIKESVLDNSYHKSMRAQMLSVIELRASDWNRSFNHTQSVSAPPPPPAAPSNHGNSNAAVPSQPASYTNVPPTESANNVFYGDPASQGGSDMNQFGNYYPDELYYYSSGEEDWQNPEDYMYMYGNGVECIQEDEMDPEIAAAFQEFLDNQPQQQQQQ